ncbi:MAG: hypothetical protein ACYDA0_10150 [Candidatus Dormibacteraceae bacterium]
MSACARNGAGVTWLLATTRPVLVTRLIAVFPGPATTAYGPEDSCEEDEAGGAAACWDVDGEMPAAGDDKVGVGDDKTAAGGDPLPEHAVRKNSASTHRLIN